MAIAAAGASAGEAASGAASGVLAQTDWSAAQQQFAQRMASGLAAGMTVQLARGGRVSLQQVATDAFGNALGQGLVDEMQPQTQGVGPWSDVDYRNGSDVDSDNAAAEQQRRDALYGLGGRGARLGQAAGSAPDDWSREVDVRIKDKSRALANWDKAYGDYTARQDAEAAARAQAALPTQHARADAYRRELDRQQAQRDLDALRLSGGPRGGASLAYGDAPAVAQVTPRSAVDLIPTAGAYAAPAAQTSSTGGVLGAAIDGLEWFQNSEVGRILQALPPEGAVVGGLKASLVGLAALTKVDDAVEVAAKGLGSQNPLYKAAVGQFKNTEMSNAGRALTKHPELIGETKETLRQALRTDGAINGAAHSALRDIMRNGVTTTPTLGRYGTVTQTQVPGGFGARWASDGSFIGFINP